MAKRNGLLCKKNDPVILETYYSLVETVKRQKLEISDIEDDVVMLIETTNDCVIMLKKVLPMFYSEKNQKALLSQIEAAEQSVQRIGSRHPKYIGKIEGLNKNTPAS